jgi:hypothetical protein
MLWVSTLLLEKIHDKGLILKSVTAANGFIV